VSITNRTPIEPRLPALLSRGPTIFGAGLVCIGSLAEHPRPALEPAFALADPAERLRAVLTLLYGWYRENAPMQRRMHGERATVPELDAWLARSYDVMIAELVAALSDGFERPHAPALVALALDFGTWQRLDGQGLDDGAAAELMTGVVQSR
jgi:hypothetical protein